MKINYNNSNLILSENSSVSSNRGFTLVELSIVLVIIGLILAGVLVGQDLIRSAEARAIISQIDKYNAAVNAFRNKFAALPGDYPQALIYIQGQGGVTMVNGDGNGLIATGVPGAAPVSIAASSEHVQFWAQMGAEGLVDGNYNGVTTETTLGANFPWTANRKGGIIAYAFTDRKNYWHIGLASTAAATVTVTTAANLSPNAALQIDAKTDDGLPSTGTIQARGGTVLEFTTAGGTFSGAGVGGTYCVNSTPTPNVYNSAAGSALFCQLRLQMM